MRYEVVENEGQWIVRHGGVEVARYGDQNPALDDVARRLRDGKVEGAAASLSMRFEARRA
jgi:hypothetical protein